MVQKLLYSPDFKTVPNFFWCKHETYVINYYYTLQTDLRQKYHSYMEFIFIVTTQGCSGLRKSYISQSLSTGLDRYALKREKSVIIIIYTFQK